MLYKPLTHSYMRISAVVLGLAVLLLAAGSAIYADKLTLEESIKLALEGNPRVRIAAENLHKAEAMIDEVVAGGMPKLTLDGTYQRVDEVAAVEFGDESVEIGSLENRTADLSLTQPIDVFGVVRTSKKIAGVGRASYNHEFERVTNDVTLETKIAYLAVLRAQKQLFVQQGAVLVLETHLKDAQAHYTAGTIAKFDVLRAETELANARQGLIAAQNGVELAKSAFNNVLGRPLDTPVELIEPDPPAFVDVELPACVNSACESRPEVRAADAQVRMSDGMVKIANLSGKPRFNFRWTQNHNFDTSMFNPRENSWQAFLTTTISIYDGGATRAAADKARSDANNARSGREQVVQGVTLDAQQSYLSLKESQERIRAAEKGLEQARESMRLAQVRYRGGVSTQVELIDAQAALTLAETNHVNALYDYQVALAKLERAVGGRVQIAKLTSQGSRIPGIEDSSEEGKASAKEL